MNTITEQVAACRRAQPAWANRSVRERLHVVRRFRQSLAAHCDELCAAVEREIGRSAEETVAADILPLADACKFLECDAARLLKPRKVSLRRRPLWLFGQRDTVYRRPHGVVGIIGTWNYPLFLNGGQIAQALTAGNGVCWKPSEVSVATAPMLHRLWLDAGAPADVLQLLPAERDAGAALIEADIDHVVFTGSAAVGRKIAARLGERLISSTLELSGCDAMFVLADADVEMAAKAAWLGFTLNRGQTCIAVRRAFVQRSIYAPFIERLQAKLAVSDPMQLVMPGQVKQADRLVADAQSKGGRVLEYPSSPAPLPQSRERGENPLLPSPGFAGEGLGVRACPPRIIAGATPAMALCREDCFAPLLAVLPFDTPSDALCMDAECRYGLGSSVFTNDVDAAKQLAPQLRTGMVSINDAIVPTAHPATPFGGRGFSGWGSTQGPEGLLGMTVPQVVSVRSGKFRPHYEPTGGPGGPLHRMLQGMLEWRHAPRFGQRFRGFWKMFGGGWRLGQRPAAKS
jgi:acyl-CoA reductase-like NAD-dependent aldehyde dehydrogenase